MLLDEVVDKLIDTYLARRSHILRTEFDFGLALENRFLDIEGNSTYDAITDIRQLLVLIEELLDSTTDGLTESGLVGAPLDSVLSVDKGIILITRLVGVREGNLNIFARDMNNRIKRISGHALCEQVEETVLGDKLTTVIVERKAGIEIRVVAKHGLNILVAELIIIEEFFVRIRRELNARTTFRLHFCAGLSHPVLDSHDTGVFDKFALMENSITGTIITERLYGEIGRKCIYGLCSHTVQTDGFLKGFIVIFTTGIDNRNSIHHLTQWNSTSVVTNRHLAAFDGYINDFTLLHAELVDGVVDCFFNKNVYTIVSVTSVAKLTDIHTRTQTNMLETRQGDDITVVVLRLLWS